MSDQFPAPLTPPDCDLRGLSFMPLDAQRLLDSDLFAIATGDEFKAAVALWCKSWFQVPAASLPNDDRILAHLSGAGSGWKKVREVALRNWVLCEDGRLYHPIVAEKALEAWPARIGYQTKKSADAERKERERQDRKALFETLRGHGQVMPYDTPTRTLRALVSQLESRPVTPPVTEPVTPVTQPVTAKTGTGTGTGTVNSKAKAEGAESEGKGSPKADELTDWERRSLSADQTALGLRIPPGWEPTQDTRDWIARSRPDLAPHIDRIATDFRLYAETAVGAAGQSHDWQTSFRRWALKEREHRNGTTRSKQSDLEARNAAVAEGWQPPEVRDAAQ